MNSSKMRTIFVFYPTLLTSEPKKPHRWYNDQRARLECGRSGQIKDYVIGMLTHTNSTSHAVLRKKCKDWCARNEIMCPSGATYIPVNSCLNKLALLKSNQACWCRTNLTSSSSHWRLTCSRRDIAEKLLSWHLTTITHPVVLACHFVS